MYSVCLFVCVSLVAMEAIANKLFERFLLLLEAKVSFLFQVVPMSLPLPSMVAPLPTFQPAGKETDRELIGHAQLLMFKFSHIRSRIKKVADHFLSLLVDKSVATETPQGRINGVFSLSLGFVF